MRHLSSLYSWWDKAAFLSQRGPELPSAFLTQVNVIPVLKSKKFGKSWAIVVWCAPFISLFTPLFPCILVNEFFVVTYIYIYIYLPDSRHFRSIWKLCFDEHLYNIIVQYVQCRSVWKVNISVSGRKFSANQFFEFSYLSVQLNYGFALRNHLRT